MTTLRTLTCFGLLSASIGLAAELHAAEGNFTRRTGFETFAAAVSNDQGGLLAVGWNEPTPGRAVGLIHAEDASGRVTSETTIEHPNAESVNLYSVARTRAGDYAAAGSARLRNAKYDSCFVARFRDNGEVLWRMAFGGGDSIERCYFVVPMPNGDLLVGGRTENPEQPGKPVRGTAWLVDSRTGAARANSRHEYLARPRRGPTERSAFRTATLLADGAMVFGGWATDTARGGDDVWLLSVGPNWAWRWEHRYGQSGDHLAQAVVPDGSGGILYFGYGPPDGTAVSRGLVGSLGANGAVRWEKSVAESGPGPDFLRAGLPLPDGRIVAVGSTRHPTAQQPLAWAVELDRSGERSDARVFSDLSASSFNAIVLGPQGRRLVVGSARVSDREDLHGWTVRLDLPQRSPETSPSVAAAPNPSAPAVPAVPEALRPAQPAGPANLGAITDARPQLNQSGQVSAGEVRRHSFSLAQPAQVEVVLIPQDADLDLVLKPADGASSIISDHGATAAEFIRRRLPAGEHAIEVVGNSASRFQLSVRRSQQSRPNNNAITVERQQSTEERRLVEHGLELLGYSPGEVDGVFTGATRAAISAFQARLGDQVTGTLEDPQRLRLAVAAAEFSAQRAQELARRSDQVATGRLSVSLSTAAGGSVKADFGRERVLGVGNLGKTSDVYKGQWRMTAEGKLVADGLGVSREGEREWSGEFAESAVQGYAVQRRNNQVVYLGEWAQFDPEQGGPIGYGVMVEGGNRIAGYWTSEPKRGLVLSRRINY